VLGLSIEPKTVDRLLVNFGLHKSASSVTKEATWSVPSYRRDLKRDVDLIEEVVRAYGVQKISGSDRSRFTQASAADRSHDFESALRDRLVGYGLNEARTSKLIPEQAGLFAEKALLLRNPLTKDHVALRPSLSAGLLTVLERNIRAGAERVAIFEIGRVFLPHPQDSSRAAIRESIKEERRLGILLWGNTLSRTDWRTGTERRHLDLFDLKGLLTAIGNFVFQKGQDDGMALTLEISLENLVIGFAGQLSNARAASVDAMGNVVVAELNLDALFTETPSKSFRDLDKFPTVTRDIALIVPENVAHEQIVRVIENPREPLLESVGLFDLFSGGTLGAGRKSLAYRLTYRDKSRTLTNEEVSVVHAKIRERLQRELGAELRE
jgi:phenylalanyl-tRNA synthetase beta chain